MLTETITWRPVAEGLPDAELTVLVACDTKFHSEPVWIGFHDGEAWREANGEPAFVTHWAQLPAAPADARMHEQNGGSVQPYVQAGATDAEPFAEVDAMVARVRELRGDRPFDEVRQAFNAAADRLEVLASKLSEASMRTAGVAACAEPLPQRYTAGDIMQVISEYGVARYSEGVSDAMSRQQMAVESHSAAKDRFNDLRLMLDAHGVAIPLEGQQ